MNFNNWKSIVDNGFWGFKTVKSLWKNNNCIPKQMGVYLVIDPNYPNAQFVNPGVGGFFKGKNPNVSVAVLKSKYYQTSQVVYIGKAGGSGAKATLYSRLNAYLNSGKGKSAPHWGGRYIWQIKNPGDLIFCWQETSNNSIDPVFCRDIEETLNDIEKTLKNQKMLISSNINLNPIDIERALLNDFILQFGKKPFANI